MRSKHGLIVLAVFFLSGCAQPYYTQVLNEQPVANTRHFPVTADTLYQAVIQSMLERNFLLENESKTNGFLLGKRTIQDGRRTASILLQAKIVPSGEEASTVYLNGVQTTEVSYVADRTRFFLFLIPLPGGGGKEASSIKEGEKTIRDPKFYDVFFKTIAQAIASMPARVIAPAVVSQPITPVIQQPVSAVSVSPQQAPAVEQKETAVPEAAGETQVNATETK
jgi:hypothetical protein